eukprot:13090568-Alexandrium_andersonii.AAC.1
MAAAIREAGGARAPPAKHRQGAHGAGADPCREHPRQDAGRRGHAGERPTEGWRGHTSPLPGRKPGS